MNNLIKILLICILAMICIILGFVMSFLMRSDISNFSFNSIGSADMELVDKFEEDVDNVEKFYLNLRSADVEIKEGTSEKVLVEYYSNVETKTKVEYEGKVIIVDEEKNDPIQTGVFTNVRKKVILYVPAEFTGEYEIKSMSGDTKSEIDLSNNKVSIDTKSGDISLGNAGDISLATVSGDVRLSKANDITIATTSGDISASKVQNIEVATTSGDITINEAKNINAAAISGDVKIGDVDETVKVKTTSGEITVKKIGKSADIGSTSGDVEIDTIDIKENSNITTLSGDVKIKNNVCNCYVETESTSGDAKIEKSDRKSDIVLKVKTTSGDIKVEG